ncbi:unnamed protein product [Spodoptera littoralis]|uniref:Ubiquitin-like domain-containing protein n=1 Tax=Spodoptera littoralis TaxID=7109 RepID=A0A9P0I3U6_SPOLI|nr:unnamed protein product [Spodoptera littoralis]CAH1638959.1 unnamed protein product [Spodoptera littoralis]
MSQHGCPERLSNRSKGFQDDGPSQPTMEVLVETLTGTAFEMTVLPTDTIFAIKSKIFRVEGIPVSQQHLLYNLKELEDSSCLREHAIGDGARLRLVLGMRGGPISTRRLPPPPNTEPWRDIERLLDTNREDVEWGSSGCKVTVLVFRDGERVNMLRVKENHDGTYSPLEHSKLYANSPTLTQLLEREIEDFSPVVGMTTVGRALGGPRALHDNAVTMGKMLDLRRRMDALSLHRPPRAPAAGAFDKVEIQKTRSEETLSVPSLLEETGGGLKQRAASYAPISDAELAPRAPPRARRPRPPPRAPPASTSTWRCRRWRPTRRRGPGTLPYKLITQRAARGRSYARRAAGRSWAGRSWARRAAGRTRSLRRRCTCARRCRTRCSRRPRRSWRSCAPAARGYCPACRATARASICTSATRDWTPRPKPRPR